MKHKYKVKGMTCQGCANTVKEILDGHPEVLHTSVDLENHIAEIKMERHVSTAQLNDHLKSKSKYSLEDYTPNGSAQTANGGSKPEKGGISLKTYKPLILIFIFLVVISTITSMEAGSIHWSDWMHAFMAGFFITFSFFKFLDLKGFAMSYSTYDLLAKRFQTYGYIYPFLELGLGLAYLSAFSLHFTYVATIVIMGFSSIGVVQSVLSKNRIQCACLGVVFDLPMSTVTIIENGLMIAMAAFMLWMSF